MADPPRRATQLAAVVGLGLALPAAGAVASPPSPRAVPNGPLEVTSAKVLANGQPVPSGKLLAVGQAITTRIGFRRKSLRLRTMVGGTLEALEGARPRKGVIRVVHSVPHPTQQSALITPHFARTSRTTAVTVRSVAPHRPNACKLLNGQNVLGFTQLASSTFGLNAIETDFVGVSYDPATVARWTAKLCPKPS